MGSQTLEIAASLVLGEFALDIALMAEPGDVIGLTGDIGSGKSSTLALIAGRLKASSGCLTFCDEVWDEPATATFVKQRPVTLMSQRFHNDLPEDLTGTEVVAKKVAELDHGHQDPERTARLMLAELGVGDHVVDRLPWTFSGAEAQRVALAKALAPRPPIVLIDEPFGAMDKRTGSSIRQWLRQWLNEFDGITIIASTRTDHLEELTTRVSNLGG